MSKAKRKKAKKVCPNKTASKLALRHETLLKQSVQVVERVPEQTLKQTPFPYDKNLLERARTQWQFGDWQSLAQLNRNTLQHHPDRAKLALLAASGRLQTGQDVEAKLFIRLAQDWGVSKELISQILIAGVHNSLGRAFTIGGKQNRAMQHFENAIAIGMPNGDVRLLAKARIGEQLQQLKLLGLQIQPNGKEETLQVTHAFVGKSASYPAHIKLRFNSITTTLLGLSFNKNDRIRVLPEAVEYQTESGVPLYLVSNESGNFEKPPQKAQLPIQPDTAYLISGILDHEGSNNPIVWIFQYANGKKIDAQSINTKEGRFRYLFVTKSEMESFAIGIRLVGNGRLNLDNTLLNLQERPTLDPSPQFEERIIKKLGQVMKREVENLMMQNEACIRLQNYLGPDTILPDMHNWSVSPDFGVLLINLVKQNVYDAVIEFGSGTSTVILAKALEREAKCDGRALPPLLSFDHLQEFSEKTRKLLRQARVSDHVQVVQAPLVDWHDQQGNLYRYYACEEALAKMRQRLPDSASKILVIVDGPPAATGKHARYPALPIVLKVFSIENSIQFLLDDYMRTDEREIVARWLEDLSKQKIPNRLTEFNNLEKKACLLEVSRDSAMNVLQLKNKCANGVRRL